MLREITKLIFIAVIGFLGVTYLTANEPVKNEMKNITRDSLPNNYEIVGKDKKVIKDELFKLNTKNLIVVGSHDSLEVVKELKNYYNIDIPFVMVANIASAPWFVKKMFIPGRLKELIKGNETPLIYDFNGDMVKALNFTDNSKTIFMAYILDENNNIKKVYEGNVKEGALDGSMNEMEKKEALKPLVDILVK